MFLRCLATRGTSYLTSHLKTVIGKGHLTTKKGIHSFRKYVYMCITLIRFIEVKLNAAYVVQSRTNVTLQMMKQDYNLGF